MKREPGKETVGSEGEREGCEDAVVEEGRQRKTGRRKRSRGRRKEQKERTEERERRKGRGVQVRRTEGRPYQRA
jgi:hypothetical protein